MKELLSHLAFTLRMGGDAAHVASMIVLVQKIRKTRSFSGLSYKTQVLKLAVFLTRYLDVFGKRHSSSLFSLYSYNTVMKVAYVLFQSLLLYFLRFKFFHSYDAELDNFRVEVLVGPGVVLALLVSVLQNTYTLSSLMYNFSVLLESVAILPQLTQLQKMQESETLTSRYIFLLGIYRAFYLLNWIIRKLIGEDVNDLLLSAGILQTLLYMHFFFLFYGYIFKSSKFKGIPKWT